MKSKGIHKAANVTGSSTFISSCCQRVFKGRFGSQFAALFYKNGEDVWFSYVFFGN
jgi:hypothetical protein